MRLCSKCDRPATLYVMGPYPGDWADRYCDEHGRQVADGYRGGAIVEKLPEEES